MTFNLEAQRGRLGLFLTFQLLGGQIGMFLILLTIFIHRQITRHAIFANFCVTWIFYSGSYVMLFYAGQIENPTPSFALCIVQAGAIYGSPVMIGVSSLVFVLHLFLVLRRSVYALPPPKWQKLRLVLMLVAPYIAYLVVFTTAIALGNAQPHRVQRSTFYCTIELRSVTILASGLSTCAVIASIVIEIFTALTLHRHWRAFRDAGTDTGLSLSILIRALVYTCGSVLALLTCMAFLFNLDGSSSAPNITLACLPMAAFLVFGTQSDLLRPWCFWRKDRAGKPSGKGPSDAKTYVVHLDSSASMSRESVMDIKGV